MAATTADGLLALVHEGWNHLMSQRPLAAWGTWQRALRRDPEAPAARQALQTLESAPDLPLVARKPHRFRKPVSESRRLLWDRVLRGGSLQELGDAADGFRALTDEAPDDAEAWFNLGLCLAWQGHDRDAIDSLDQATTLDADRDAKRAVESWAIAEILRQGGGAEPLADGLRYACTFPWRSELIDVLRTEVPTLRQIPTPRDPSRPNPPAAELQVYEWLDRPFPAPEAIASESELPRVLATVYISDGAIRLSSPRVDTLEVVEEKLRRLLGGEVEPIERVAAPLPLPFLDADVWTARIPEGVERERAQSLGREAVESYYENMWIHRPRLALDGLSPLAASQNARRGDAVVRAKLEAVVLIREQLGSRPSAVALYQGYPFDRLRRRLSLDLAHPELVDAADLSCASFVELEQIQPVELDDSALADAFKSVTGLGDDQLTTRFAAELVRRGTPALRGLDPLLVYAPLVRQAMYHRNTAQALQWLEQARAGTTGAAGRSFDTWRAEILARTRRPDAAAELYQNLVARSATPAQASLDAGETLADNGHVEQARDFFQQAVELARTEQLTWVEKLAVRSLAECGSGR